MAETKVNDETALATKKKTLEAWTMILYREGMIDLAKCNRMVAEIRRLKR